MGVEEENVILRWEMKALTYKNSEGYKDPTAGKAIASADRPPKKVREVIHILKGIASFVGFDIVQITLRDQVTGREW